MLKPSSPQARLAKIISDQFKLQDYKSDDVIDVYTVARNAFARAEAEGLFDREMELYCLMLVGWEVIEKGNDELAWLFLQTKSPDQMTLVLLEECRKEGRNPKQLIAGWIDRITMRNSIQAS